MKYIKTEEKKSSFVQSICILQYMFLCSFNIKNVVAV